MKQILDKVRYAFSEDPVTPKQKELAKSLATATADAIASSPSFATGMADLMFQSLREAAEKNGGEAVFSKFGIKVTLIEEEKDGNL